MDDSEDELLLQFAPSCLLLATASRLSVTLNLLPRSRLVVKTGSAKTKTKTANGSMKQNAHSTRKNYFYQKLQRH